MNEMRALDVISEDIKKCEEFLRGYPITIETVYHSQEMAEQDISLIWDASKKRIVLETCNVIKNLIEYPILLRKKGYDHLPDFMEKCIEGQKKFINFLNINGTHCRLQSLIKERNHEPTI